MKKLEYIEPEIRHELKKTFTETRRRFDPLMNHLHFGDISLRWWIKRKQDSYNIAGTCYKGTWRITTRSATGKRMKRWFTNLIVLSKEYYESNGLEDLKGVFKHELMHLIARDTHGSHFKSLIRACGSHRYCPPRKNGKD